MLTGAVHARGVSLLCILCWRHRPAAAALVKPTPRPAAQASADGCASQGPSDSDCAGALGVLTVLTVSQSLPSFSPSIFLTGILTDHFLNCQYPHVYLFIKQISPSLHQIQCQGLERGK